MSHRNNGDSDFIITTIFNGDFSLFALVIGTSHYTISACINILYCCQYYKSSHHLFFFIDTVTNNDTCGDDKVTVT